MTICPTPLSDFLTSPVLFVLIGFGLSACIMPPRGVPVKEPRPVDDIAEYKIKVNQTGYFPSRTKLAVYTSDASDAIAWTLWGSGGTQVSRGETIVHGIDQDAGEKVHLIDFSNVKKVGDDFTITIDNQRSRPFQIHENLYAKLKGDAIKYFYLNRSGIPLEAPFIPDKSYKRPAGHLTDSNVPCKPSKFAKGTMDVSGGWYDAGDYGKYVVNGGFSAWLLMHAFETLHVRHDGKQPAAQINIPESGNGTPDILNEARWEVEWLLKMQIADGPYNGMAFHRIRNEQFTALGHAPPTENEGPPRYISPPSTTSTLNLAAAAAICARVFAPYDKPFAEKCATAAKTAYEAAGQYPDLAPSGIGHIPYGSPAASDDFYWAAAELFVTTGEKRYQRALENSEHHGQVPQDAGGAPSAFNWASTAALGTVTLATSPRNPELADAQKEHIIAFADNLISLTDKQGYRYPMGQGKYPWGSNSFVLNNAIMLALAYQFTSDEKYLNAVIWAMDYILGRNPIDFSYVTGYGDNYLKYPHHRFFAPSYNNKLPYPPAGSVAGGPNSAMQDKSVQFYRRGCAPAKCYIDNIESFSTNEVAINWNAALVWVAGWLDEFAR